MAQTFRFVVLNASVTTVTRNDVKQTKNNSDGRRLPHGDFHCPQTQHMLIQTNFQIPQLLSFCCNYKKYGYLLSDWYLDLLDL
jgi:hypothetical protein